MRVVFLVVGFLGEGGGGGGGGASAVEVSRRRLSRGLAIGAALSGGGPHGGVLSGAASAAGEVVTTRPAPVVVGDGAVLWAESAAYAVKSDSTAALNPSLERVATAEAVQRLGRGRAVFLGEHHNAAGDHVLQASLVAELRKAVGPDRPLAVGFEAVQQRFQPVLDAYSAGRVDGAELRRLTEWETRWFWPFELYEPVFEACRAARVQLVALNADSEDLARVELGGFAELGPDRLRRYVPDAARFAAFSGTTAFKEYVAYVVAPSYEAHRRMGILRTTISGQRLDRDMPFRNFYSGRMLWDAAMASAAADWSRAHPDGLFVGIVGADHVKFGCGVPARYAQALDAPLDTIATVLLNPATIDTKRDDGGGVRTASPRSNNNDDDAPLTLQLRFAAVTGDDGTPVTRGDATRDVAEASAQSQSRPGQSVLALADLLWVNGGA